MNAHTRIRRVVAPTLLLGLFVAVSCGDSGVEPKTTTPPPPPVVPLPAITSFAATPARITSDQNTTLAWSVTGAESVSIDQGVGVVNGSSAVVTPVTTKTYTLTATNSAGRTATATTTVTVTAGVAGMTLTWNSGSSVKLEQVIGDKDWAASAKGTTLPTASLTASRYGILGTDIGSSFENNGKAMFLFGDILPATPSPNFGAPDPIAFSTTTDGDAPLQLTFITQSDGKTPFYVRMPGINMGAGNVPHAGIALADGTYFMVNAGSDVSLPDAHQNSYSMLVRYDQSAGTFTAGRTVSSLPGGHFVFNALHASGSDVYMFGLGKYRASDIYLSVTPASGFWAGTGTRYYTGLVNGQPTWSTSEAAAVPLIRDNPLNAASYTPSVGYINVGYSAELGLWYMTYDGGAQSSATRGVYFTYAKEITGPWATPQLIFNPSRDNAYGVYIHNPNAVPSDGLFGPTIGDNDPVTTLGAPYAPLLIERFTKVAGNTLKVYYLISTWNPYTVVKLRSEFTIGRP